MPVTFSIQALIDAQTTALTTTINAARDNVKADNTTQITSQNTALTTAINAARDNVKADNVTQVTAQTTAINGNTDTKTAALLAKGNVKSIQRGVAVVSGSAGGRKVDVTIAPVDMTKAVLILTGSYKADAASDAHTATLTTQTNIEIWAYISGSSYPANVSWQLVEYF